MALIRVLLVFANPRGTDPLRLGREDRVIRQAIKLGRYRDLFSITSCHAATTDDLRRALLEDEYQIVHISGHGSTKGLILEDELGEPYLVPKQALANLFHKHSPPLRCVLLNSCFSISQGELTSLGVPFTIAMENSVLDETAIEFSRGFYDALGAGEGIEDAYDEGCSAAELNVPDARLVSILLRGDNFADVKIHRLDRIKLGQICSKLLQCRSADQIVYILVPVEYRSSDADSVSDQAARSLEAGEFQKGVDLSYIGMALALRDQDVANLYTCAMFAYQYSVRIGPEALAETIATTWPLLAYWESHNPGKPPTSMLGHVLTVLKREGRRIEAIPDSHDLLSLITVAIGGLGIFQNCARPAWGGFPIGTDPHRDAMVYANALERRLGLVCIKDWVKQNCQL